MVIVEIIEHLTFSYDEDDDLIKLYETDYEWKKISNSTTHVTFECRKSAMFTSDEYRKGIMDE